MRRPQPNRSDTSHRNLATQCRASIAKVLVLGLLTSVLLEGCATYHMTRWEPPPKDQYRIKVGTHRSTVEEILGEPIAMDGPVHTFEFSTQDRRSPALGVMLDFLTLGTIAVRWGDMEKVYQSQRARRQLAYGPDDRVISTSPHTANFWFERWLNEDDRAANLELLCKARNDGSADAHAVEAVRYHYGLWGTEVDPVKAYLSLKLAAFLGNPGAAQAIEVWRAGMTPDDLAEADLQFASWQPIPCDGD